MICLNMLDSCRHAFLSEKTEINFGTARINMKGENKICSDPKVRSVRLRLIQEDKVNPRR